MSNLLVSYILVPLACGLSVGPLFWLYFDKTEELISLKSFNNYDKVKAVRTAFGVAASVAPMVCLLWIFRDLTPSPGFLYGNSVALSMLATIIAREASASKKAQKAAFDIIMTAVSKHHPGYAEDKKIKAEVRKTVRSMGVIEASWSKDEVRRYAAELAEELLEKLNTTNHDATGVI